MLPSQYSHNYLQGKIITTASNEITMVWKKGESGNPKGRKPEEVIAEIREAYRAYGEEAIERLVYWMRCDDARASLTASIALLDRAYGKPTTEVNLTSGGMSLEELVLASLKIEHNTITIENEAGYTYQPPAIEK